MTKAVFHPDMKRFYLAYSTDSIWRQPVAKLDQIPATTEFLRQLVAQIPWNDPLRAAKQLADAVREALPPRR